MKGGSLLQWLNDSPCWVKWTSIKAKSGFWIGGTDAVVEGEWIWITSQAKFSYDDWADDFPDDYEDNEDCAHLWSGVNYSWNDSHCDERMNFICEKP